ncbi:MAG: 50S ribosomal protein L9 [Oscillospiraceae bacterium]|jgi:large subunit ribosomal protein L9|nr:50S ribosomal protein L9 [Oscillospiraceae bacterium]
MKVILQQDVKGQGKKGQMVEVSDGYGRNFLLPRKLAVEATAENVNTMKMQDKAKAARLAEEKAAAQALAERLEGVQVKIKARAGQGGKLFGSITSKEISEELKAQFGLDVGKSKIVLSDPIKSFGAFDVKCKLGSEVSGVIHVLAIEDK